MPKLTNRQIAQVALEAAYGQDPGSSYQGLLLRTGANVAVAGEEIVRDTVRRTLSPRGHVIGRKEQTLTYPLELRGAGLSGSSALQVPEIDALLQACQLQRSNGGYLVLTNVVGTFERGETVTNTSAGGEAGTVADFDAANATLYLRDVSSLPGNGDSVEGDDSNATGDVSTSQAAYVYRPQSLDPTQAPSVTVHHYEDGIRHVLKGARGTFTIEKTVGQIPSINFTMSGLYERPTDETNITPDYLSLIPDPVQGAKMILSDVDLSDIAVNAVTFDLGNDVQWRDDVKAPGGRLGTLVGGRDPTGSLDPEAAALSVFNPFKDWDEANPIPVAIGTGSEQGKRIRLVVPAAQYTQLPYGERNGIRTFDLGFRATGDDDEFMLIYS